MKTKRANKRIITAILALILALSTVFSISGCSQLSALQGLSNAVNDLQKYQDAVAKLTDYKITMESTDESGNKTTMTEMRCDKGYELSTQDSITFVEYGTGKMYMLNPSDKTGYSYPVGDEDTYKGFGSMLSLYLYAFEVYRYMGAVKSGTDKIAGRKTTSYTFSSDGTDYKFWIDDEYGLTLKSTTKTSTGTSTMEITEFKTKGISLSDMVKISDYTIQDSNAIFD